MRLVELPSDLRGFTATAATAATASYVHAQSKLRRARMRRLRNPGRLRGHLLLYSERAGSLGMRQLASGRVLVGRPLLLRLRDLSARVTRRRDLLGQLREYGMHMPMK